jgi:hypothetical protein
MQKDRKCTRCASLVYRDNKTGLCRVCLDASVAAVPPVAEPQVRITQDREKQKLAAELAHFRASYKESLKTIERQEQALAALSVLKSGLETHTIEPKQGQGTSEGTVVMVASDWHVEETVGAEVGGLNISNITIATRRAERFFQSGLRLLTLLQQDISVNTVVLALLGDFISNDIHEEFPDINEQQPMHALVTAQNMLISGIEFLLDNSPVDLVIPCHSGNHARTTRTTRFSAENGHSLEYLMYLHLATYFRDNSRVTFIIPAGMHSYLDIYDTTVRFQHGHSIKYGGGVGGIYIPVNKAIAQWNKARHADLDVFGHFHQMRDGGNFICNGSLIGYNAFALAIKADYEQPKQALFLIDKKRGRTCTWPILVG